MALGRRSLPPLHGRREGRNEPPRPRRHIATARGRHPWRSDARLAGLRASSTQEGAELLIGDGDERNEAIYEASSGSRRARTSVGEPLRLRPPPGWRACERRLARRGVAATLNACGRAIETHARIAAEAVARGTRSRPTGWRWERHVHMDEGQPKRRAIAQAVAAIADARPARRRWAGTRARPTSPRTRDLLIEQGGFLYDLERLRRRSALHRSRTAAGPHVCCPTRFDTKTMRFYNNWRLRSGGISPATDRGLSSGSMRRCAAGAAECSSIRPAHPQSFGRPGADRRLEAFLDSSLARPGVVGRRRAPRSRGPGAPGSDCPS